jgi:hypothetical protein
MVDVCSTRSLRCNIVQSWQVASSGLDALCFCSRELLPSRVQTHVTSIAIRMHNVLEKLDGIHRDAV